MQRQRHNDPHGNVDRHHKDLPRYRQRRKMEERYEEQQNVFVRIWHKFRGWWRKAPRPQKEQPGRTTFRTRRSKAKTANRKVVRASQQRNRQGKTMVRRRRRRHGFKPNAFSKAKAA